ncbi:MAG: bifunctional phosphoribosylaminoimidazolecarboxamide formyltransferase/IMP cyclohydrolase [Zoogloeaceae bacterium]|jgi:phosphoribosylaminoimidazolecarboxamide formyltransferase/IMP cyclohydrolase|nr:bifunctional phosphoribosylaminoimidazolecarboxamide formyltransferase/IMP cyclohydrolase [Zoogloeaceae bacterium]
MTISQALISVSDKTGVLEFARGLSEMGVQILSTGGTAKLLRDAGLPVREVGEYTGFPEMLDGRVKTLHPKIHGGILARRDFPAHRKALAAQDIPTIDLVCVNLYPFKATVAKPGVTLEEAIENIDIGGPAMVRSAAKNYADVAVLTDPEDYAEALAEMRANAGVLSRATRFALAKKAFVHTARYDGMIANWLTGEPESADADPVSPAPEPDVFPERLHLAFDRVETLRYGENPHQKAAFYRETLPAAGKIAAYRQLQGKALSYNNIADSDAAWECVKTFSAPACAIIKHANPCGAAIAASLSEAYEKALMTDPDAAFGGILAFNEEVDADVIEVMIAKKHFVEVLIAPAFTEQAQALLQTRKNLRVLEIPTARDFPALEIKRVGGGLLLQTPDDSSLKAEDMKVVTRKQPTPEQVEDMFFAWRVAKFVKSNAIVFCARGMTLGIGAGQMSRVDSTRIAGVKAANAGLSLQGSVVASDAFFPFRDGVDVLADAGAAAVIQPGGSVRDEEVIAAADEHGLPMIFTGVRNFRH